MSQSLSKLYVHAISHIKSTSVTIKNHDKTKLYRYISAVIKDNNSIPIEINGTHDHVHILFVLSKNLALAKFMEEIKKSSSRWIKGINPYYKKFSWQGGYGGFSVSPSKCLATKKYIQNQEVHHQTKTVKEELIQFYKEYGIDYDERYLLKD